MEKQIHFVSGLPRAGSTLLMNLMAQHPQVFATPTSACHESLFVLRNHWGDWQEHKADAAAGAPHNLRRVLAAMLAAYHDTDKPVVADKGRGWLSLVELAEFALGRRAKVIVCVRDIAEILASFEALHRKNAHLRNVPGDYLSSQSTEGRCAHWAGERGELGIAYNRLRDALQRGLGDRLLLVEFDDLTARPAETMARVWAFLGVECPAHDFETVAQVTHEDDSLYTYPGMHDIRTQVRPVAKKAEAVLGRATADKYRRAEFWRA